MKETKARVEDALHATRAAAEEGIVPGGGMALLRVIPAVQKVASSRSPTTRRSAPRSSLRALEEPIRYIASNAGHDGGVVADEVKSRPGSSASMPTRGEYVDMFEAGSSTRPRSPRPPSRTPLRSRPHALRPRP